MDDVSEERMLAIKDGKDIISVDDETKQNLLNMNPLGEVLTSMCKPVLATHL